MAINPLTATTAELQSSLTANSVTSKELIDLYLGQIARHNDYLKAVIATSPKEVLYKRATELDSERASGTIRGPLHGIPILLKVIFIQHYRGRRSSTCRTILPRVQS